MITAFYIRYGAGVGAGYQDGHANERIAMGLVGHLTGNFSCGLGEDGKTWQKEYYNQLQELAYATGTDQGYRIFNKAIGALLTQYYRRVKPRLN